MITISLCMIVKNEEAVLARCLESIKHVVDEIIIVDTGSTDSTKAIAQSYTAKVYDFEWIQDFAAARNEAFSKASCDYQMWLDADDVFPENSAIELLLLKETLDPAIDIVTMKYHTHFDDHGNPIFISTRERLLKRKNGYTWQDPVHEFIPLIGNIMYSDIVVHHKKIKQDGFSTRNLEIYKNQEKTGKPFTPRQLYYYARELKDHGQWINAAYYFEKFLNTKEGWIEDNIATCYNLSICYSALGDSHKIMPILLKSLEYDAPRAEVCCEIGYYYKHNKNYATALKWFQIAASMSIPDTAGFILKDYWGYIPNIECCVCYCHLGDYKNAGIFNERAAIHKPGVAAVDINRKYLASITGNAPKA